MIPRCILPVAVRCALLKHTVPAYRFTAVVEADPTHSGALTDLGNLWLRAGSLDDAITYYQRALALVGPQHENNQASALHNLGQVYKQVCSGCHRGSVVDGMEGAR